VALTPNTPSTPKGSSDQSDAFLREVDDDFRREQLQSLWQRHGRAALTAVSLLLIGLGSYLFWQNHKRTKIEAYADQYMDAAQQVETGQTDKAKAVFQALSKDGTPGYRAITQFDLAAAALAEQKPAQAQAIFVKMATDASLPKVFRDYATLRSTMLNYDSLKPAEIVARLSPLAQETNPWFGTAGELVAVAHLKAGKPAQARPLFEALQRNSAVPMSIRARAQEMARMLGTPDAALKPLDGAQ
jgi:hypothetical protein